jgi:hypothetical protein
MCLHSPPHRAAQVQQGPASPSPVRWSREKTVRAPSFRDKSQRAESALSSIQGSIAKVSYFLRNSIRSAQLAGYNDGWMGVAALPLRGRSSGSAMLSLRYGYLCGKPHRVPRPSIVRKEIERELATMPTRMDFSKGWATLARCVILQELCCRFRVEFAALEVNRFGSSS